MSTFRLQQELSTRNILRGIERLREEHPATINLTISLKLRTTRFKENMLKVTQQRVTNMKSEVLASLQLDLEQINSGATGKRFIDTVLGLCNADNSISPSLRQELEAIVAPLDPLALPIAMIKAVATAEASESGYAHQLRDYLDLWQKGHRDGHLDRTLERAAKARRRIGENEYELRYTPEQLTWIRYAILLRKVLQDEHTKELQARRIVALAELAELSYEDAARTQEIDAAIAKRSAGQATESLITVICASVKRLSSTDTDSGDKAQALRDTLVALAKKLTNMQRRARQKKTAAVSLPGPFIRELIGLLAAEPETESDHGSIKWLWQQLEHWYSGREAKQQQQLQQKWQGEYAPAAVQRIRYAVLLNAWLEDSCTLATEILILAELAEATIREMNDGVQLLFGIISRCYSETCSRFKYPLTGVLRQATFSKCAEGILGWSQLVIDYKVAWDRRIPGNQLPAQKPGEEPTVCRKNFFLGLVRRKRITALPYIYHIWQLQEAAYREILATEVPIGPDAGKTLGNPETAPVGVRQSKGWRRSRVRGERVVGKRGARRIKRWLLKESVVRKTLEHLEVLEYPEIFPEDRRDEAKAAPHPYWTAKRQQRRSVKAVRPAQFRHQTSKKPARLGQLNQRQRFFLRIQLRELKAYAPQFAAIEREIDEFLEAAPPRYPSLAPVIFSEQEARHLPFEAQMPLPELQEARQRAYEQDLELLRDFRPSRGGQFDSYTAEGLYDIEALRAQRLEQSAAALLPTKVQPIAFHRTMSAELDPKSFTLLVFQRERQDKAGERYIFACELAGDDAPERAEILQRARAELKEPREFVNYPGRYVQSHEDSGLLFFAVEIGDKYQGRILRELYDRQRQAPIVCKTGCPYKKTQTGEHLLGCAPAAAMGTATITSTVNGHGHDEWFAQLTIPTPTPPCEVVPTGVIGLHEHDGQLYFAVVDYTGKLLDIGEIAIPDHVGPQTRKGKTSKNFAFEIAWQIVRQSQTQHYLAGIAIEDTGWKRNANNTSAEQNRQRFAFPREKIMSLTALKAAQSGILPPVPIKGVAPTRDCGRCGHQLESSGVRLRSNRRCPHCTILGKPAILEAMETRESMSYKCPNCQRIWEPKIAQFKCSQCGHQQYAPYNAAIAVARAMLAQLSDSTDVETVEASSIDAEDAEAIDEA